MADDFLLRATDGLCSPPCRHGFPRIVYCRPVWKLLLDGKLARKLEIEEQEVAVYAQEALTLLERRLGNAAERPFKDKSLEDLINIIEENTQNGQPSRGRTSTL